MTRQAGSRPLIFDSNFSRLATAQRLIPALPAEVADSSTSSSRDLLSDEQAQLDALATSPR